MLTLLRTANKARHVGSSNKCVQRHYKFWNEGRWASQVIYTDISPWFNLCPTHLCNLHPKSRGLINVVTHWSSEKVGHITTPAQVLWNCSQLKFTGRGYIKVAFAKIPLPRKDISTNSAMNSAAFLLRLSICWPKSVYIPVQSSDRFFDRDNIEERG